MWLLGGDWEKDSGQDQSPGLEGCVCISTRGFRYQQQKWAWLKLEKEFSGYGKVSGGYGRVHRPTNQLESRRVGGLASQLIVKHCISGPRIQVGMPSRWP